MERSITHATMTEIKPCSLWAGGQAYDGATGKALLGLSKAAIVRRVEDGEVYFVVDGSGLRTASDLWNMPSLHMPIEEFAGRYSYVRGLPEAAVYPPWRLEERGHAES